MLPSIVGSLIPPTPEEVREARGLFTQAEAADLALTSRRTWQDWEAGVSAMPPASWWLFRIRTRQAKLGDIPTRPKRRGRPPKVRRNRKA